MGEIQQNHDYILFNIINNNKYRYIELNLILISYANSYRIRAPFKIHIYSLIQNMKLVHFK